jgi:mRNA interferase MazF
MLSREALHRGDIVTIAGGSSEFGSKPRPAVLLQSPALYGEGVLVPICPITSHPLDAPLLRIPLASGEATGLRARSWAAIDAVQTIRPRRIGACIGHLDAAAMLQISRALVVFLGID